MKYKIDLDRKWLDKSSNGSFNVHCWCDKDIDELTWHYRNIDIRDDNGRYLTHYHQYSFEYIEDAFWCWIVWE